MTNDQCPMGLRYVGSGSWRRGVPARDLTPDEVEECGGLEFLLSLHDANTGGPLYALPDVEVVKDG